MRITTVVLGLFAAMLFVPNEAQTQEQKVAPQTPLEIAGIYLCVGISVGGGPYEGLVEIQKVGEAIFHLRWKVNGETQIGIGILDGNLLAVGFSTGGTGVLLYRIIESKSPSPMVMRGQWTAIGGDGGLYPEVLTKIEGHPKIEEQPTEQPKEPKPKEEPTRPAVPGEIIA